ncbi:MAG: hypothetical protein GY710_01470 [Desulfobacteraceae bacterium]|nr:hypothetical protein [Desulfobacteraceae bacterium]
MKKLLFLLFILIWAGFHVSFVAADDLYLKGEINSGFYHNFDGDIIAGKEIDSDAPCSIKAGSKVIAVPSGKLILKKGFSIEKNASFTGVVATSTDSDSDGIPDWWEHLYGLDPLIADDAALDQDYDGISNFMEFLGLTDPNVHEAPIIKLFTAQPQAVLPGAVTRLTWESRFTEKTRLEPGSMDWQPANGTALIKPSSTTTYILIATGPGGTTTKEITITVNPALPRIVFNAFPLTIYSGALTRLSWTVPNADTITIDNGIGTVAAQGQISLNPLQDTAYRLTAENQEGQTSAEIVISVQQPRPKITLTAHPIIVSPGQAISLSWTSQNASAGSIDQGVGLVSEQDIGSGTMEVIPNGLTTYTIIVTGPGGSASAKVVVGDETDTDADGIPDVWEITHGMDAADPGDAALDYDGDLLSNKIEYDQNKDPESYDGENILVSDSLFGTIVSGGSLVVNSLTNNTASVSSDKALVLKANCKVIINPVFKVPKGARLSIQSGDCDKLPDDWEIAVFGTTEYSHGDDPDNDGLSNYQEYLINSDPLSGNGDTDGDGLEDQWELVHFNNLDQGYEGDADGDGVSNGNEQLTGTDPADVYSIPKPGNYYEYDALGRIKRLARIK